VECVVCAIVEFQWVVMGSDDDGGVGVRGESLNKQIVTRSHALFYQHMMKHVRMQVGGMRGTCRPSNPREPWWLA